MKCPRCAAWSRVLDTREQHEGYTTKRRHECANGHRFISMQVLGPVYGSAKQRNATFITTAKRRAELEARNRKIRAELAAGVPGMVIAMQWGVSESLVSLVARGKC